MRYSSLGNRVLKDFNRGHSMVEIEEKYGLTSTEVETIIQQYKSKSRSKQDRLKLHIRASECFSPHNATNIVNELSRLHLDHYTDLKYSLNDPVLGDIKNDCKYLCDANKDASLTCALSKVRQLVRYVSMHKEYDVLSFLISNELLTEHQVLEAMPDMYCNPSHYVGLTGVILKKLTNLFGDFSPNYEKNYNMNILDIISMCVFGCRLDIYNGDSVRYIYDTVFREYKECTKKNNFSKAWVACRICSYIESNVNATNSLDNRSDLVVLLSLLFGKRVVDYLRRALMRTTPNPYVTVKYDGELFTLYLGNLPITKLVDDYI